MAVLAGKPITKVTLFLYTEDLEKLRKLEGYGWSSKVREVVHQWLQNKMKNKILDFLEE